MIYNKAFLKGNFDVFKSLVTEQVPDKLSEIKTALVPSIDNVLESMLKGNRSIEKTEINVDFLSKNNSLEGLKLHLLYTVADFQVADAPQTAIDADKETIKAGISQEDIEIEKLEIDVNEGLLTIDIIIPFVIEK